MTFIKVICHLDMRIKETYEQKNNLINFIKSN